MALSTYLLVAILKRRFTLDLSLHKILHILSVSLFEKTPILQGFLEFDGHLPEPDACIQLEMFTL